MASTVFISKKQKQRMRERRRKKKRAEQQQHKTNHHTANSQQPTTTDDDSPSVTTCSTTTARKRPHPQPAMAEQQPQELNNNNNNNHVIVVPQHLSGKEARTFRKLERRKWKAQQKQQQGNNTDPTKTLVFVSQPTTTNNTAKEQPNDTTTTTTSNQKNKRQKLQQRVYPNINQLVQESQKQQQQQMPSTTTTTTTLTDRNEPTSSIVFTQQEYNNNKKYVAMDCEMVGTGSHGRHSVLARVSMVDAAGSILLDTFVQVPVPVTDFRTFVSGIAPSDIHKKNAKALPPHQVRTLVAHLLQDKILVGHALHNDMAALYLNHPKHNIRDTAHYRPFQKLIGSKWKPRKLRDLVKEHLPTDRFANFQVASHDSVVDAQATMELFATVQPQWERELELQRSKKAKSTHSKEKSKK